MPAKRKNDSSSQETPSKKKLTVAEERALARDFHEASKKRASLSPAPQSASKKAKATPAKSAKKLTAAEERAQAREWADSQKSAAKASPVKGTTTPAKKAKPTPASSRKAKKQPESESESESEEEEEAPPPAPKPSRKTPVKAAAPQSASKSQAKKKVTMAPPVSPVLSSRASAAASTRTRSYTAPPLICVEDIFRQYTLAVGYCCTRILPAAVLFVAVRFALSGFARVETELLYSALIWSTFVGIMILAPFFIAVVPFANLLSLIQWATGKRPSPNLALVLLLCILFFFPRFGFYHWVDLTALRALF